MAKEQNTNDANTTRRQFIKHSGAVTSAAVMGTLALNARVHAAGSDTIRLEAVNIFYPRFADRCDAAPEHGFCYLRHPAGHLGDAADLDPVFPAQGGDRPGVMLDFVQIDGDVRSVLHR